LNVYQTIDKTIDQTIDESISQTIDSGIAIIICCLLVYFNIQIPSESYNILNYRNIILKQIQNVYMFNELQSEINTSDTSYENSQIISEIWYRNDHTDEDTIVGLNVNETETENIDVIRNIDESGNNDLLTENIGEIRNIDETVNPINQPKQLDEASDIANEIDDDADVNSCTHSPPTRQSNRTMKRKRKRS
jgi:hypothetical protein